MNRLLKIKAASRLPSYSDLMYCINELINGCSDEDEKIIKYILERAIIVCPEFKISVTKASLKNQRQWNVL